MFSLFIFKTSFLRDHLTDPLFAKADSLHGLFFHAEHGLVVADEPVRHQFEFFDFGIHAKLPTHTSHYYVSIMLILQEFESEFEAVISQGVVRGHHYPGGWELPQDLVWCVDRGLVRAGRDIEVLMVEGGATRVGLQAHAEEGLRQDWIVH